MENITRDPCFTNAPGLLLSLEYAALDWVCGFSRVTDQQAAADVTFHAGFGWKHIEASEELEFEESYVNSQQGDRYQPRLTGRVPKNKPETLSSFLLMSGRPFLVKITDQNGYTRILGAPFSPLKFSFQQVYSPYQGYIFEFSGSLLKPSVYL